jgi:plastocyanin
VRKLIVPALVVAGLGLSAGPASSAGTTVRLRDNVFSPKSRTVARNSTVTFRWAGRNAHNVVVTKGPVKFTAPARIKGSFRRKLTRKGTYTVICTLHIGMRLKLRVR